MPMLITGILALAQMLDASSRQDTELGKFEQESLVHRCECPRRLCRSDYGRPKEKSSAINGFPGMQHS
jgi:hypothetical protein